ncbi:hypothetical protein D9M71_437330 [compost metagenome]
MLSQPVGKELEMPVLTEEIGLFGDQQFDHALALGMLSGQREQVQVIGEGRQLIVSQASGQAGCNDRTAVR